jgi:hypothetical protein
VDVAANALAGCSGRDYAALARPELRGLPAVQRDDATKTRLKQFELVIAAVWLAGTGADLPDRQWAAIGGAERRVWRRDAGAGVDLLQHGIEADSADQAGR